MPVRRINLSAASTIVPPSDQQTTRRIAIKKILSGQIDGDYDDLVAAISGPLYPIVSHIFPAEFQPLYILTETKRQQVWHAYFSAQGLNEASCRDDERNAQLRTDLLRLSNRELLSRSFGSVPGGFEKALGKLGLTAKRSSCYVSLHRLLSSDPSYRHALSHQQKIDEQFIDVLAALGPKFSLPSFAAVFRKSDYAFAVSSILQSFIAHGLIEEGELSARLKRVRKLRDVSRLIDRIYRTIEFPKALIPTTDFCRPIKNAEDLERVAHRFRNCLSSYAPEVIRGELYFYEWLGDEPAVIQLRAERPFGWLVEEINGIENTSVSDACVKDIYAYFQDAGVPNRPTIESVIRWSSYAGHRDWIGHGRNNYPGEILTELEQ